MNIEIKAFVGSVENFEKKVRELSKSDVIVIKQHDIFFIVPNGRLKLRLFEDGFGELIYYERPDTDGPKVSSYKKTSLNVEAAQGIKEVLSVANGVLGNVIKTRHLYMIGQTRVHVDRVDGLGDFMELEVVLRDNQNVSEGEEIANDLMKKLDVKKENLISGAYLDLLIRKKS
ncbi:uncharacterized protein LOC107269845 [Cephus cinctus]|uniref:Uncharacterized protein LOC107269845 n=1 Tax=Cephus cinctus TaxID=211228 RepID=A0AAJ7C1P9_CEPCN|nr:uncharacterized protein LOC107269845 [Cephus cinctus]